MIRSAGGLARSQARASAMLWSACKRVNSRRAWSETGLSRLATASGGMRLHFQIPRHVDDDHVGQAAEVEIALEKGGRLVVQEVVIPAAFDQLGNDDGDGTIRLALMEFEDVVHQGGVESAIGGGDDDQ